MPRQNHHPATYLRYRSRLRGTSGKPITRHVIDTEYLRTKDIIVSVRSEAGRRFVHMHLDRINGLVWLFKPGVTHLSPTSPDRVPIGTHGEFLTL